MHQVPQNNKKCINAYRYRYVSCKGEFIKQKGLPYISENLCNAKYLLAIISMSNLKEIFKTNTEFCFSASWFFALHFTNFHFGPKHREKTGWWRTLIVVCKTWTHFSISNSKGDPYVWLTRMLYIHHPQ